MRSNFIAISPVFARSRKHPALSAQFKANMRMQRADLRGIGDAKHSTNAGQTRYPLPIQQLDSLFSTGYLCIVT
jgi:hypothetical protein